MPKWSWDDSREIAAVGTPGKPNGVVLTHGCWTYEGACVEAVDVLRPTDLQYLWLPLSHSFGKVLLAAQLQIGFTSAVDGRVDKIVENLAVVRPTFSARNVPQRRGDQHR